MIFEGVTGGKCHNCGYDRCELRFGTGGWFQFEACPRCGFGFGNSFDGSGFKSSWNKELWDIIEGTNNRSRRNYYEVGKLVPIEQLISFDGGSLWEFRPESLKKGLNNLKESNMEVYED